MPDNLTAEWAQELADAYREEVKRVADERRPADLPAEYAELADAHFEEEVAREWEGEIDELADETSWQVEALKAYERALDRRPLRVGRLIRRARQAAAVAGEGHAAAPAAPVTTKAKTGRANMPGVPRMTM